MDIGDDLSSPDKASQITLLYSVYMCINYKRWCRVLLSVRVIQTSIGAG